MTSPRAPVLSVPSFSKSIADVIRPSVAQIYLFYSRPLETSLIQSSSSFESLLQGSLSSPCVTSSHLLSQKLIKPRIHFLKKRWRTQWHFLRLHHDNGDGASSQHGGRVLLGEDSPELQAQHGGVYGWRFTHSKVSLELECLWIVLTLPLLCLQEQYRFCYELALEYLECLEVR